MMKKAKGKALMAVIIKMRKLEGKGDHEEKEPPGMQEPDEGSPEEEHQDMMDEHDVGVLNDEDAPHESDEFMKAKKDFMKHGNAHSPSTGKTKIVIAIGKPKMKKAM